MDCDLVSTNETHLLNKDDIHLPGYRWIGLNRTKLHVNAAKGSGGVGIFLKERLTIEYKIDIIDNLVHGILGIKFMNKVTFVVFSCYLPPESSPWCLNALSFFWDSIA